MSQQSLPPAALQPTGDTWQSAARFALLEFFFIFVVFFVHAGFPTPDDSEAHYLSIAKHAWNPDWIPTDLLLSSTNVHVVFSTMIGWISLFTPLAVFAWVGRVIVWGLLAWGWRRLAVAIAPQRLFPVLSAALFVTLSQYGNMSREWAVGGLEAKGLAYAFVLFAMERLVRAKWNQALAWFGIATSVHVVVGGWATLAGAVCWCFTKNERGSIRQLLPGILAAILFALPGLIPALRMVLTADSADVALANKVYVFYRLPHHLWPPQMDWWRILRHAVLIGFVISAFRYVTSPSNSDDEPSRVAAGLLSDDESRARLARFFLATIAAAIFSAIGFVFAYACFATQSWNWIDDATVAGVLKFYWFRLSDVLGPAAAALLATRAVVMALDRELRWGRIGLTAALLVVSGHLGYLTLYHQAVTVPRADSRSNVRNFQDWRAICREASTLPGANGSARFVTPWNMATFKWYSSRSDVVNLKDIPQDAASIVAWWNAMRDIYQFDEHLRPSGSFTAYPLQELVRFGRDYDADYLITDSNPSIPGLPRVAQNNTYAIYQLRAIPSSSAASSQNAEGK